MLDPAVIGDFQSVTTPGRVTSTEQLTLLIKNTTTLLITDKVPIAVAENVKKLNE